VQITALDGRRVWGLRDEEVLIGYATLVSVALENLQTSKGVLSSEQ
jgi:hypothetical protein